MTVRDAVEVYIERAKLIGYTSLSLTRSKSDLTGSLNIDIFMGWIPSDTVLPGASSGKEILVYVGGNLSFTGIIDRRRDAGEKDQSSGSSNLSIGADSYTVSFSCRGKTKHLVDSSHQHPTGTMLKPTNKEVFENLVAPWGIQMEWEADVLDLNRVRFRDGGRVVDELHRVAAQCSLYVHETVDGKLRVTDKARTVRGQDIILGSNILSFSTDQMEDTDRSEITVKGQLTDKAQWGTEAVISTLQKTVNATVLNFSPITVQLFGNATADLINRRTQFEANRRSAESKQITLTVFHVQQPSGDPWDVGDLHYVEIPPAGVYDIMEITDVTYDVQPDKKLSTTIKLAPATTGVSKGVTEFLGDVKDVPNYNKVRASSSDPDVKTRWSGPVLSVKTEDLVSLVVDTFLVDVSTSNDPPKKLT